MNIESLPGSLINQIDRACDEFESVWNSKIHRPSIEEYLDRTVNEGRPTLLRVLLTIELKLRRADGENPIVEEYLTRFPTEVPLIRASFNLTHKDTLCSSTIDHGLVT